MGPEDGRVETITAMDNVLDNVHEIAGTGTLFPNENGEPVFHSMWPAAETKVW